MGPLDADTLSIRYTPDFFMGDEKDKSRLRKSGGAWACRSNLKSNTGESRARHFSDSASDCSFEVNYSDHMARTSGTRLLLKELLISESK